MLDLAGSARPVSILGTEGVLIWEFGPLSGPSSAHASSIPVQIVKTWQQILSLMPQEFIYFFCRISLDRRLM
jgi:hypothetical protein